MCGSSSTTRMVATASMLLGRPVLLRRRRLRLLRLGLRPLGPARPGITGGRHLGARLGRHAVAAVPPAASPAPRADSPTGAEDEEQDEQDEEEGQEPEEPEE